MKRKGALLRRGNPRIPDRPQLATFGSLAGPNGEKKYREDTRKFQADAYRIRTDIEQLRSHERRSRLLGVLGVELGPTNN